MKTFLVVLSLVVLSASTMSAQNQLLSNTGQPANRNNLVLAQSLNTKNGESDKTVTSMSAGIETQVVLRADGGMLPSGLDAIVKNAVAAAAGEYDQPSGGRTVIRLNGVWQQLGGQWRLFFRVVADHLIYAENRWTRLGDSQTVTVVEVPKTFANTLGQAMTVAVSVAIEGTAK